MAGGIARPDTHLIVGSSGQEMLSPPGESLDSLAPELLRKRWRSVTGRPAPPHLSPKLMARILMWREQIALTGDLDPATRAMLKQFAGSMDNEEGSAPLTIKAPGLRPGTVLVREHAKTLHRVMVLTKGFAWNDGTYRSLSEVARAITGTNWNGRRFFGLDKTGKPKTPHPPTSDLGR